MKNQQSAKNQKSTIADKLGSQNKSQAAKSDKSSSKQEVNKLEDDLDNQAEKEEQDIEAKDL